MQTPTAAPEATTLETRLPYPAQVAEAATRIVADVGRTDTRHAEAAVINAIRLRSARQSLLDSGSISVRELAEGRGRTVNATHAWLRAAKEADKLISVTVGNEALVPLVLLDAALDPIAAWEPVLRVLAGADVTAWDKWDWIESPTGWLDGDRAVDLIHSHHEVVVDAAQQYVAAGPRR